MTESPDLSNAERAARLELAIMDYNDEYDAVANLIDLLADARHWCDTSGRSYGDLDRVAHAHYLAKLESEGGPL